MSTTNSVTSATSSVIGTATQQAPVISVGGLVSGLDTNTIISELDIRAIRADHELAKPAIHAEHAIDGLADPFRASCQPFHRHQQR